MFVSMFSAIVMFAAPEAAEGGGKPAAKPAVERICHKVQAVGSSVPRKKCVTRPVKDVETVASAEDKAQDAAKTE